MDSFFLCNSAALEANLSRMAFKVYSFLAMGANNKTRSCFHSKKTIAQYCNISLSSVVRATRELRQKHLLEIQKRFWGKGHQTSNLYILLDNPQLKLSHTEPTEEEMAPVTSNADIISKEPESVLQAKPRLFKCNSFVFQHNLTPTEHKIYAYLVFRAGKDGQCYPSKKEIAADCGVSVATVIRVIRKLRLADLIEIKPQTRIEKYGNNGASANLYILKELKKKNTARKPITIQNVLIALLASLSPVLTPTPMSLVTPQRTMSRKKVTLKQRKTDFISKVAKRISMHFNKFFAGGDKLLAKLNDG